MDESDKQLLTHPVPPSAVRLFRLCWQLETWLRHLVYVELRAHFPSWTLPLEGVSREWPPRSLHNDKQLHHMSTDHEMGVSYLTFGELWRVIANPNYWPMFASYFPPRQNIDPRIEEIRTIRNRVAHCRSPHANDELRLELFLRDLAPGLADFCRRYSHFDEQIEKDEVATAIAESWQDNGHAIEMLCSGVGWLFAPGDGRMRPKIGARFGRVVRLSPSAAGVIYRLELHRLGEDQFDLEDFLNRLLHRHKEQLVHVLVESSSSIVITFPGVVDRQPLLSAILCALDCARNSFSSREVSLVKAAQLAWPEQILWPTEPFAAFALGFDGSPFDFS